MLNHSLDVRGLKLCPLAGTQSSLIQHLCHGIPTGTFFRHFHKHFPDPFRFIWIDFQILYGLVSLVDSTLINSTVSIRDKTSGKMSTGNDLTDAVPGSHRGLFALPCCLPEPDIVHQLITVTFDTLLAFVGAPHLDAVLDEPFQYKGCFTLDASQPVKHIHKKDIEVSLARFAAQFLNHIPLTGGNFGTRDFLLGFFQYHTPAMLLGELPTGDLLHRDIVVVHLSFRGNSIGQGRPWCIDLQPHLLGHKIRII